MIAEEAIVQIRECVNELGDVWSDDIILFAEVTGSSRLAPVRCIRYCRI